MDEDVESEATRICGVSDGQSSWLGHHLTTCNSGGFQDVVVLSRIVPVSINMCPFIA